MIGAMMLMTGTWNKPGVHNIEEFLIRIPSWKTEQMGTSLDGRFHPVLVDWSYTVFCRWMKTPASESGAAEKK